MKRKIELECETAEKLKTLGLKGETYDTIINRLIRLASSLGREAVEELTQKAEEEEKK